MFINFKTTSLGKYFSIFTLIFTLTILSAGCQKKAEQPEGEKANKDTTNVMKPEQPKPDTTKKYLDLTGTWTGKFDSRTTTFIITEQNEDSFKGQMTVSYKKPLNKDVSGKVSPEMQVTMKDLTHSRFMGNYSGKLSDDGKKLSGSFTMNSDNSKYNFTFTKK